MHKLTDNEYLPDLTDGYGWIISLRKDGHAQVSVWRRNIVTGGEVVSENVVWIKQDMDELSLKKEILASARAMMLRYSPWNPEGNRIFNKIVQDITPPKDDDSRRQSLNEIAMEARGL